MSDGGALSASPVNPAYQINDLGAIRAATDLDSLSVFGLHDDDPLLGFCMPHEFAARNDAGGKGGRGYRIGNDDIPAIEGNDELDADLIGLLRISVRELILART